MQEYIERLCACGMRVDDAFIVCNDFGRELDYDGLVAYVEQYETIHEMLNAYVD